MQSARTDLIYAVGSGRQYRLAAGGGGSDSGSGSGSGGGDGPGGALTAHTVAAPTDSQNAPTTPPRVQPRRPHNTPDCVRPCQERHRAPFGRASASRKWPPSAPVTAAGVSSRRRHRAAVPTVGHRARAQAPSLCTSEVILRRHIKSE